MLANSDYTHRHRAHRCHVKHLISSLESSPGRYKATAELFILRTEEYVCYVLDYTSCADKSAQIVYLPSSPTPQLQSFAAPLLKLHDTHVTAPWFGPNVWTAVVQPVQGGGIPSEHAALELKITFKDGGAFDFSTKFERVKERLSQAVDIARESGQADNGGDVGGRGGGGDVRGVNLDTVNLEDLPAYTAQGQSVPMPTETSMGSGNSRTPMHSAMAGLTGGAPGASIATPLPNANGSSHQPPDEPPPGYDEATK